MFPGLIGFDIPESAFPGPEQLPIQHIQVQFHQLTMYVRRFEAALELFTYAEFRANQLLKEMEEAGTAKNANQATFYIVEEWRNIAVRDSAFSVFHFGKLLKSINFQKCPSLKALVPYRDLTTTRRLFEAKFPHWDAIRHAVGHSGDAFANPDELLKNCHFGPYQDHGLTSLGGPLMVPGYLQGNKLVWTRWNPAIEKGEVVWAECSPKAFNDLLHIRNLVLQTLLPAREHAIQVLQERAAKNAPATALPPEQD